MPGQIVSKSHFRGNGQFGRGQAGDGVEQRGVSHPATVAGALQIIVIFIGRLARLW